MQIIGFSDMIDQLRKDLIGKDSYRGITLSYAWLANQLGHYTLGFIPTIVAIIVLTKFYAVNNPALWSSISVSVIWLVFESFNFLAPILKKSTKHTFKPQWGNLTYDTFTDLCYFWLGAFSAHLLLAYNTTILYILIGILILLTYAFWFWYTTKIAQQNADYPMQFRLSQWNKKISDVNKKAIEGFIADNSKHKHLLIFGGKKSGKTSLAVGLANENSIKHKSSTYTTAIKFFELLSLNSSNFKKEAGNLWQWRTANYLVIDDINPGYPVKEEVITCKMFNSIINNAPFTEENKQALQNQKVIWVAGNKQKDNGEVNTSHHDNWVDFIVKLGIEKSKIKIINLQDLKN